MSSPPRRPPWLHAAERADLALYAAVAAAPTPRLDRALRALTRAADHSGLWFAAAGALVLARGRRGRKAAAGGLGSLALTSLVVNAALKPLARRPRPDPERHRVPLARHVPMPASRALPSGHAAGAVAVAGGVRHVLPRDAARLRVLAALVAYSRVHAGVHFPGDVLAGALLGAGVARVAGPAAARWGG